MTDLPNASERLRQKLRTEFTFQISVDTARLEPGLMVARAALAAGITLLEIGTPLCKCEGIYTAVPAFRQAFPESLILADMKSMDGAGFEARGIYQNGGNIIDFLALAGVPSARNVCAARDEFRAADPSMARLAFADILLPHQGPAAVAMDVAERMVEAGVDGVGIHLQLDARRADPGLMQSNYLADVAQAVFSRVGKAASVQVVGGLSIAQAKALAQEGLRAFVISGNMGVADSEARFGLPEDEMQGLIAKFIAEVSAA